MSANTYASTAPREELSLAIMEGAALNKAIIWDQILPPLGLTQRTAHLPKLGIANAELHRIIQDLSAPGADIPRMTAQIDDANLNVAIRKQEIGIPLEAEMDYSKLFSLESFYAQQLGNKVLSLTAEWLTAAALFSTTNFGAATNSTVAYTVANKTTNSMMSDIVDALNRVLDAGELADTVVIPALVLERAAGSSSVTAFVQGQLAATSEVNATTIELALKRIGWDVKVFVGRAQYNSGAKGAKTLTRIWSSSYIWVGRRGYKNESTDAGIPLLDGVGQTPYWLDYGLMVGESYLDQPREQQVVRGKMSGNPTILNANAGTLIATQFA